MISGFLDLIMQLKDELLTYLNPSAFTTDSVEGWIVLFLCLVIVYKITKNAGDFIGWCIGLLFIIQLGYWLSLTNLNNFIPLSSIFKYNILVAVAQCFVGTKLCDFLLYCDAFIQYIGMIVWNAIEYVFPSIKSIIDSVLR